MKSIERITLGLTIALLLCAPSLPVAAQVADAPVAPVYDSPVIITELQTGAAAGGDEFVELYNTSDQPVDISGWQIRYANSTAAATTLLQTIATNTVLPARNYFVLHTDSVILPDVAGQVYAAKLSASDKVVALFAPDTAHCTLQVVDAVAWGSATGGEGLPASLTPGSTGDRLVQRLRDPNGFYNDVNDNAQDFLAASVSKSSATPHVALGATPGSDNSQTITDSAELPATALPSQLDALSLDGCVLPADPDPEAPPLTEPDEAPPATVSPQDPSGSDPAAPTPHLPAADAGLAYPQVSELLPNPAKPQTDAADEFIELYNANDATFDLSGFSIVTGLKTNHSYTFPAGTTIPPRSFRAFFSADTKLTLSNTSGQTGLLDPFGNLLSQSDAYASAKDGQAWALAAGRWQWTTSPTPNASNLIKVPPVKVKAAAKAKTSVKAASTTLASSHTPLAGAALPVASTQTASPGHVFHTGVLALVLLFAVLYGAYEYRSDVANRIHQFRAYRAARRENRPGASGR